MTIQSNSGDSDHADVGSGCGAGGSEPVSAHLFRVSHAPRPRPSIRPAAEPSPGERPGSSGRGRSDYAERARQAHGCHIRNDVFDDQSARAKGLRRAASGCRRSSAGARAADDGGGRVRDASSVLDPVLVEAMVGRLSDEDREAAIHGLRLLAGAAQTQMAERADRKPDASGRRQEGAR